MPRSNVVITGMGVVSSIGIGCDAFFHALMEKRSGIVSLSQRTDDGALPGETAEPPGLWIGGLILDFDPKQFVRPRKALKVMCREIQIAYAASQLAIEHAGLAESLPADAAGAIKPSELGTVFGSEMFYGPPKELADTMRACLDSAGRFDESKFGAAAMKQIIPLWMLKYLPNMPACHVGIALNAHGPNNSIVLGDVSGSSAVVEAASCIERGIAKVMISGATGTRISTTRMNYRGELPIPDVTDPVAYSSRPHDGESTGVVGGEAAAALVLESPERAAQRHIKPHARIVSHASRFVPAADMRRSLRTNHASDQNSRGSSESIRLAIQAALDDAGISACQLGLVVSHAMGDPSRDAAEREAIEATVAGIPLVAPIASLGHTGSACGAIGLTVAALSLSKRMIPPTLHHPATGPPAGFLSSPQALESDYVLSLAHNSEGNATAIILSDAS